MESGSGGKRVAPLYILIAAAKLNEPALVLYLCTVPVQPRFFRIRIRQQVETSGQYTGISCHLAPVRRTGRMPFMQERFVEQGLSRPHGHRLNSGGGGFNTSQCSSLQNFCRLF